MWKNISALKGKLPAFDASVTTAIDNQDFKEYFDHYGFQRLEGRYQSYHFGSVQGELNCACHYLHKAPTLRIALVVHGLFDHVGLFLPLIVNLLEQNMNVVAIDLPDHGLSGLEYGEVSSFSEYSACVESVFEVLAPSLSGQLTLIGQSTGAAVLFDYLANRKAHPNIDQLVMLAPLLRARAWRGIRIAHFLFHRFIRSVPRSFQESSHDENFCKFMRDDDPMQPDIVSVDWVGAMLDWAKRFDSFESLDIDALLVQGSGDMTVDFRHNIRCYQEKLPNLRVSMIDGAKHHLVGEAEHWRNQVFRIVNEFITEAASAEGFE